MAINDEYAQTTLFEMEDGAFTVLENEPKIAITFIIKIAEQKNSMIPVLNFKVSIAMKKRIEITKDMTNICLVFNCWKNTITLFLLK